MSPAVARKRPAPDRWSIAEIGAHISDTELVVGYRVRAILEQQGAPIIGCDQDEWVKELHYEKRDLKKCYWHEWEVRDADLNLMKRLTPEQWKHAGMHNERGEESVETIVRMMAGHDLNHFSQIERILAAKKGGRKR